MIISGLKERKERFIKTGILLGIMLTFLFAFCVVTFAEETQQLKQGTLVTLLQDTDMYEKPDGMSKILFSFKAGDAVFQTGEAENGWYPVMYHMVNGYINASGKASLDKNVYEEQASDDKSSDEVGGKEHGILKLYADEKTIEEMDILDDQMNNFGTNVELDRKHRRESRIWGTVIVLLILAFVGSSILPTIKEQKKIKAQKDEADKDVT